MTQRSERPGLPSAAAALRVRIVSANLWNGEADPDAFAELVTELAPDAVAVQELTPPQADALARVLPHGQLEPARDYTGMGIALREPAPVRRLGMPFRDANVATLPQCGPWGTFDLELLNVHIIAPHTQRGRALGQRRAQLAALLDYLSAATQRRRVLVGDLNSTPLWPVYRRLSAHLTDAAVLAARQHGRRVRRTWGPWHGAPRLLRIDHALVHGVAVADFQLRPIAGGDHSAIVVDIGLPAAMPVAADQDETEHLAAIGDQLKAAAAPPPLSVARYPFATRSS